MDPICVIVESTADVRELRASLAGFFEACFFLLGDLPDAAPGYLTLVSVDLRERGPCSDLRNWLKRRPRDSQAIFCVRRDSHAQAIQAFAMGATGLIARPVTGAGLRAKLNEKRATLGEVSNGFDNEGLDGVGAGVSALYEIFDNALKGQAVDARTVDNASQAVTSTIDETGVSRWVEVVRKHHSQTYQHCLLVTGIAVGFARSLGFRRSDKERIAAAALLHDIGKARVPVGILEKCGPLDEVETAVMRQHPLFGLEALENSPGLQPEMIDMVAHHHEYLDGSGYPHGLEARSISDLVRTITIADIYGALIERRSYKPPIPSADAYGMLMGMGGKLDRDLVREFRALAQA